MLKLFLDIAAKLIQDPVDVFLFAGDEIPSGLHAMFIRIAF